MLGIPTATFMVLNIQSGDQQTWGPREGLAGFPALPLWKKRDHRFWMSWRFADLGVGWRKLGAGNGLLMSKTFNKVGFPGSSDGKKQTNKQTKPASNAGDPGWIPELGRFASRREWQPTPVFLPREFHRQPWGHKRVRHYWATNTKSEDKLHLSSKMEIDFV